MSQTARSFSRLAVASMVFCLPWFAFAESQIKPVVPETVVVSDGVTEETVGQSVVVATTEIYDAQVVSQSNNEITILFNLYNKTGVQSGVVYGVELYSKGAQGNQLVDTARINVNPITLGPDETLPVAYTYQAPSFLVGKHELWVTAKTESGMLLSIAQVDTLLLQGNGKQIDLTECQVAVAGKRYALSFGVAVSKTETVKVVCTATNYFDETKKVAPVFVTHERSAYGPVVSTAAVGAQSGTLAAGKETTLTFTVPLAQIPQTYDATMLVVDEMGNRVSPQVVIHYVIDGENATVQNVVFDKASYNSGDIAELLVTWSVSADTLSTLRDTGTGAGPLSMSVVIADAAGAFCSSPLVASLDPVSAVSQIKVPISRGCENPQLLVGIATEDGVTLGGQTYQYAAVSAAEELTSPKTIWSSLITVSFIGIGLTVLLAIAFRLFSFAFIKRIPKLEKEYSPNSPSNFDLRNIAMLLVVSGGVFLGGSVPTAQAITFYAISGSDMVTFTMSTSKSTYVVNEQVQVSGSASLTSTSKSVLTGKVDMVDGTGSYTSIGNFTISSTPSLFSKTITGYSAPTSGSVSVRGTVTKVVSGITITSTVFADLPFTVSCPTGTAWNGTACVASSPAPSGDITSSGCYIAAGNSTCTATFTWDIDNASSPSVKNVTTNTLYSNNAAGTNVSRTINYGVNVVVAYDATTALDTTTVSGVCSTGTSWNGSLCEATVVPNPSGVITASSCEITTGQSSCVTELDWSIAAATSPNIYNTHTGIIQSVSSNSNVPVTITHGSHTFEARDGISVLDTALASAECQSDAVWNGSLCVGTATLEPVTVSLTANGDKNDSYIISGDDVQLQWSTTGAIDQCTASGGWTGAKSVAGGTQWVTQVTADSTFTIECIGLAGSDSDTVQVHVQSRPNLVPIGLSLSPSSVFDTATGVYDSLFVQYSVQNAGETAAGAFVDQIKLDRGANGSYEERIDVSVEELAAGADTPVQSLLLAVDVPFGSHQVFLKTDVFDAVTESDEGDNEKVLLLSVPVPDPNIELSASPSLIRSGGSVTVSWDTKVTFPMDCEVRGPKLTHDFDPRVAGAEDSRIVSGITAKSEYHIQCTEPSTGTTFTDTAWVEVLPTIQEI